MAQNKNSEEWKLKEKLSLISQSNANPSSVMLVELYNSEKWHFSCEIADRNKTFFHRLIKQPVLGRERAERRARADPPPGLLGSFAGLSYPVLITGLDKNRGVGKRLPNIIPNFLRGFQIIDFYPDCVEAASNTVQIWSQSVLRLRIHRV